MSQMSGDAGAQAPLTHGGVGLLRQKKRHPGLLFFFFFLLLQTAHAHAPSKTLARYAKKGTLGSSNVCGLLGGDKHTAALSSPIT